MDRIANFKYLTEIEIKSLLECHTLLKRVEYLLNSGHQSYMADQIKIINGKVFVSLNNAKDRLKNIQKALDKQPCKDCGANPCWCLKEG